MLAWGWLIAESGLASSRIFIGEHLTSANLDTARVQCLLQQGKCLEIVGGLLFQPALDQRDRFAVAAHQLLLRGFLQQLIFGSVAHRDFLGYPLKIRLRSEGVKRPCRRCTPRQITPQPDRSRADAAANAMPARTSSR